MTLRLLLLCCACVASLGAACPPFRVPLTDIGARFAIADMTWFEEEQTLFVFYRVDADQGLSDQSQIEITYLTDEVDQPFVHLQSLPRVHPHVRADCGLHSLCGSFSLHVALPPRNMDMRLRYHEDGALTLGADVAAHTIFRGPRHTNTSATVYGVFDAENRRIQWRLRHQFPGISNPQATKLGLRRAFRVLEQSSGTRSEDLRDNPYGFALRDVCPASFAPLDFAPLETTDRAVFHPAELPLSASADAHVCADVELDTAIGPLSTSATAQKNPEVREAYAALQSRLEPNRPLRFLLMTCDDIPSQAHLDMQIQRLFLQDAEIVCARDDASFEGDLTTRLQQRVDDERGTGPDSDADMILVIGLQRREEDTALARTLERALASIVPFERDKSSPRLTGAFVFDSAAFTLTDDIAIAHVLWCPADTASDLEEVEDTSERACAIVPDQELVLGPLSLSQLPILPSRRQYSRFVNRYGVVNAGEMTAIDVFAPRQTPQTRVVPFEPFGVMSFYDNDFISTQPEHAFSYCADSDSGLVVFEATVDGQTTQLPLALLPTAHELGVAANYPLGLAWDFPFLLHLDYIATLAGAGTAYGFSIPFGRSSPAELDAGGAVWLVDAFEIGDALLQCTRFCAHPTFDSAGVYNVLSLFADTYAARCYRPTFPSPPGTGFPDDP